MTTDINVLQTTLVQAKQHRIDEIVIEINNMEVNIQREQRAMVVVAAQMGAMLIEMKSLLPHGEFIPYVTANCVVRVRQAQQYIKVAERKPEYIDYDPQATPDIKLLTISEIACPATKKSKPKKHTPYETVKKLWGKLTPEEVRLLTGIMDAGKAELKVVSTTNDWMKPTQPDPKILAEIEASQTEEEKVQEAVKRWTR